MGNTNESFIKMTGTDSSTSMGGSGGDMTDSMGLLSSIDNQKQEAMELL